MPSPSASEPWRRRARPRRGGLLGHDGLGSVVGVVGVAAAEHQVAGGGEALGDAVDRGRGHDEEPEERHAGPGAGRRRSVLRSRSVDSEPTTKPTAPPASCSAWVWVPRGLPWLMWMSPRTPKSRALQPMTWRPAGPVRLGVAHGDDADAEQRQRDEPAEQADRAVDDGAGGLADAAGQAPPDRGGDDDGQADEREAETVATVVGVEVAGGAGDPADDAAEHVGDPEPEALQAVAERAEGTEDGARSAAYGAGCGALRLRRGALARGTTCLAAGRPRLRGAGAPRARPGGAPGRGLGAAGRSRPRWGRRTGRHAVGIYANATPVTRFPRRTPALASAAGGPGVRMPKRP